MKLVFLCHFSSESIRTKLPLNSKGRAIQDFAPWVPELIKEVSTYKDIELHVIAPYDGLKKWIVEYCENSVHYHFFRCNLPVLNKRIPAHWPSFLGGNYSINRFIVHHLIRKIKPDIVNLLGAENAYYSSCILGLNEVPIFITIQGIYSNPERFRFQKENKLNSKLERLIHRSNKYFGINASFMPGLIKRDVENPILFWNRFPIKAFIASNFRIDENKKKYDLIQFSRLTGSKGVFDLLSAIVIVKQYFPHVKVRMVGPASSNDLEGLNKKIKDLSLSQNIILSGAYPNHEDVLKDAAYARISVLPTRIDTIPISLFESVYLGLPVVSCNTGDIPLLNIGDERILLSDVGDTQALAMNIVRLLSDFKLRNLLAEKSLKFVKRYFSNSANVSQHILILKAVLKNYREGIPIPQDLLYEGYLMRKLAKEGEFGNDIS